MRVYQRILENNSLPGKTGRLEIQTIDMHTAGEPLRVVVGGFPELQGEHVLDYRNYIKNNYDHLRTALMFEPRGHADMYGCILVPPNDDGADFGVIFMHNEGYSTMCGHAIIALSTLAVEMKWMDVVAGENKLVIDAPCGRIKAFIHIKDGAAESVKFHCVPSFVVGLDRKVLVEDLGEITYDLAYGGAFYAYVDMMKNQLEFDLTPQSYQQLIQTGMAIKEAVMAADKKILHPYEEDLSFLYGTIFIGAALDQNNDSRNVCIFAEGEVDRCPTGSGVSGRMAIHHARKELQIGEQMRIESIIDTVFVGSVVETVDFGSFDAVIPQVEGKAYITGKNNFIIDLKDPLHKGFILR